MSSSSCPTLPFPGHFGELSALCALVPLMSLPVPALYLHPTSVPGASGPHPCPLHSLPPASLQASSGLMQPWIPAAASGLSIWCQTCAPCPPILFVPASPCRGGLAILRESSQNSCGWVCRLSKSLSASSLVPASQTRQNLGSRRLAAIFGSACHRTMASSSSPALPDLPVSCQHSSLTGPLE